MKPKPDIQPPSESGGEPKWSEPVLVPLRESFYNDYESKEKREKRIEVVYMETDFNRLIGRKISFEDMFTVIKHKSALNIDCCRFFCEKYECRDVNIREIEAKFDQINIYTFKLTLIF